MRVPKRISLISETASVLKDGIQSGTWKDTLPSERMLSSQLHVSRPTVRAALAILQKEGLLQVTHSKCRRILPSKTPSAPKLQKTIGLVVNTPISQMSQFSFHVLMDVRHHLQQSGFDSEMFVLPSQDFRYNRIKLENFLEKHSIFCCILILASEEEQKWFSDKGIPALVLGTSYESVQLPSLDVDYYAVCRHAAGVFLARGHRQLAFVRYQAVAGGDTASEQGFLDGIAQSGHSDARGIVISHKGTHKDLAAKIDKVFDTKDNRPTGILTLRPMPTLMAIMHFLKKGYSIPEDISIIARDWDYSIDYIEPRIAHYAHPMEQFSQRLTRLMLQMLENGALYTKRNLVFADFNEGESLLNISKPI